MKLKNIFFSLLIQLASFSVFAVIPDLGDDVVYLDTVTKNGVTTVTKRSLWVRSSTKDKVWYQEDVTHDGKLIQSSVIEANKSSFSFFVDVLNFCEEGWGELVSVDVIAGSLITCLIKKSMNFSEEYVWVGKVPFGIVKRKYVDYVNKETVVTELRSFRFGPRK